MDQPVFRWGIIGLGHIARSFANALKVTPGAQLVAGASRSCDRAADFQKEFNVARCYTNYEDLLADADVDAVYIATRHPDHLQPALTCIAARKPVLVEKPFTVNASQAETIATAAKTSGVFCMEAMWTRFMPLMRRIRELIAQNEIGPVRMLQADFGFRAEWDPASRLLDPALAGGALLDVGVYPISLASMIFGKPVQVTGAAHLGSTGVDEQAGIVLRYPEGQIASLTCAVRVSTPHVAYILGEEGRIDIHSPWWIPRAMTVHRNGKTAEIIDLPFGESGYAYEALEVMNCVRAGKIESSILPLSESIEIMRTMDTLRTQWGLRYPGES